MEDTTTTAVLDRMIATSGLKSDSDLARYLGKSSQAVSKARRAGKIPVAWVPKIAAQFNLSTDYLFWGKGSPVQPNSETSAKDETMVSIPIVEARLSAGLGSLQVGGDIERYFTFPSTFFQRKGNPDNMVLMRVDGDSMQPEIMDGDMVLIDQNQRDIRLGRIFAVGFEEAIYLKRIDMLPGKVVMKSVNPAYPPLEFEISDQLADSFRVIGQVLWCGREYS